MKRNKFTENGKLFSGSVIFGALTRFSDWICNKFAESAFGRFLSSYDATEEICAQSSVVKAVKRIFGFKFC